MKVIVEGNKFGCANPREVPKKISSTNRAEPQINQTRAVLIFSLDLFGRWTEFARMNIALQGAEKMMSICFREGKFARPLKLAKFRAAIKCYGMIWRGSFVEPQLGEQQKRSSMIYSSRPLISSNIHAEAYLTTEKEILDCGFYSRESRDRKINLIFFSLCAASFFMVS